MIVQCPSCAARYRIRDANIPASGGKIRCPSCSHSFIVYPEAQEADEDRTSITSQGEISNLVDQMDRKNRPSAADEDYVATQIATGSELDKQRALKALRNEMGDPVDMDGTVEIPNPMKLLKEMESSRGSGGAEASSGVPPDDTEDEYDEAKTEVVDPSSVQLPFRGGDSGAGEAAGDLDGDATFQLDRNAVDAIEQATKGDSSPGVDLAGNGSGMHPYAQNTPPGGRSPQNGAASGSFDSAPSPRADGGPGPPPIPGATTPMNKVSSKPGPTDSGLTAADLFEDGADDEDLPPTVSQHAPQPARQGQETGESPDPNHDGPWKLKTNFGLTYEFPDTRGLRSWLSGREELDGYEVSHDDGATFHALSQYPQLDKDSGRAAMSGNVSIASRGSGQHPTASRSGEFAERDPSGQMPGERSPSGSGPSPAYQSGVNQRPKVASTTMRGPKVNTEYTPPSRESKYHWVLWLVFLMLLVIAVGIGLQTFGIVDIKAMVLETTAESEAAEEPEAATDPDEGAAPADSADPAAAEEKRQREVATLLEDAERLVERNKLPSALDKLQTTQKIAPQNPRVYEMIADVHERLGQADDAARAAAKAEELRAAEGLAESPDMGSGDASDQQ